MTGTLLGDLTFKKSREFLERISTMGIGFMKHGMISYVTVTVLAGTGGTAAGGGKGNQRKTGNYNSVAIR